MTTAATAANPSKNGNGDHNTSPDNEIETEVKAEKKPLTAAGAISKIGKILDQLSTADRARVLAFYAAATLGE
jgi:hypothetical protein